MFCSPDRVSRLRGQQIGVIRITNADYRRVEVRALLYLETFKPSHSCRNAEASAGATGMPR
jgi:hypothetical protein